MRRTLLLTLFLLVMIQVYLLLTLALSPLHLSLHHYYLPMCYMCLQCLKTLFQSLPFVPITLLMSCFFYYLFQVQDRHTGVTLVCGQRRDDVYYRLKSVFLWSSTLVLSSSVWSSFHISMWHSHLGHSSLHIFLKFLSVLNFPFPKNIYVPFLITPVILRKATSYLLLNQALPLPLILISFFFFLMFRPHPFHFLMVFTTMLFFLTITQSIYGFTRYIKN